MKNITKLFFAAAFLTVGVASAQSGVGVGTTTPDASSALDVTSTTKGFLMPRMTTAQRTAITAPAAGLQVYDTDTNSQWYYNGTVWVQGASKADGSKFTNDATNTRVALTNLSDGVTARPAGKEFVVTDSGKVGIGTTSPIVSLAIESSTTDRPWLLLNNTSGTNNNCGITFKGFTTEFSIFEWSAGQNLHFSSNFNTNTDIFRLHKEGNVAVCKNLYVGSQGVGTSAAARLIVVRTALTGTIASVGTTVTGTGTNFTTAFAVGDQIVVGDVVKTISSITSNTELIINTAFTSDLPSGTAYDSVNAVFSTGNVGIGTTTPTSSLSLGGTVPRTIQMERRGINAGGENLSLRAGGAGLLGTNRNGGNLILMSGTSTGTGSSAINFQTSTAGASGTTDNVPSTKMTILGNGNIGIGTTTPTSKLQVVGLPVHVDNAAAVTAGLTAGAFYHSGDGIVRVVY